jgi:hypothetical protein
MRRLMAIALLAGAPLLTVDVKPASACWDGYGYYGSGGYRYSAYRPAYRYRSAYYYRPAYAYAGVYRPRVWGWRRWGWRSGWW